MSVPNGVKSYYIRQIKGKTGHAIIQIDKSAQNCILLYGGANECLTEEYVDEVLEGFEAGDMLLLQNEVKKNMFFFKGYPTILDTPFAIIKSESER